MGLVTCPKELSTVLLKLDVSVRFPPQYRPPSPISSGSLDTHTQYTSLPQDNATPRTRYTISEEKSHNPLPPQIHNRQLSPTRRRLPYSLFSVVPQYCHSIHDFDYTALRNNYIYGGKKCQMLKN